MITTHQHTVIAIHAAKNARNWGYFATLRYCQNRGVHLGLLRLAKQLEAAK